jgi:hypothetical protein
LAVAFRYSANELLRVDRRDLDHYLDFRYELEWSQGSALPRGCAQPLGAVGRPATRAAGPDRGLARRTGL